MKAKKTFITAGLLFLAFVVYTLLIKNIDVQLLQVMSADGTMLPESTAVGLAGINGAISQAIGVHMVWYKITDVLGYLAILVVLFFGLLGVLQLISRKSLLKVDADILALGGFYVLVFAFYILFEIFEVNYRPVILDAAEGLEASYPSSHTMLAVCVFTTAIFQFNSRLKSKQLRKIVDIVCIVLLVLTVVGRMLSGVHWFTDIVGGLLLSASLIVLYCGAVIVVKSKN